MASSAAASGRVDRRIESSRVPLPAARIDRPSRPAPEPPGRSAWEPASARSGRRQLGRYVGCRRSAESGKNSAWRKTSSPRRRSPTRDLESGQATPVPPAAGKAGRRQRPPGVGRIVGRRAIDARLADQFVRGHAGPSGAGRIAIDDHPPIVDQIDRPGGGRASCLTNC